LAKYEFSIQFRVYSKAPKPESQPHADGVGSSSVASLIQDNINQKIVKMVLYLLVKNTY